MLDREQLRSTEKGKPVEVNQRALIDKVLARYAGEFTLFRELLQNSDDAQSRIVEIRFETADYLAGKAGSTQISPNLSSHVNQWTFRNNGDVFTEQDWMRLPKIAEGNPKPEKIGAFGVGFYSLFSVTDRPFVSSGEDGMEFYWKDNKNQLYFRRGKLPPRETPNPWTTFEMPLREEGPIPPVSEFMRFLASSITFMVNLTEIGVFIDEHCIGRITKSLQPVQFISIPDGFKRLTPSSIMSVEEVQCRLITIKADVAHAVCATVTKKSSTQDVAGPPNQGGFPSNQPQPEVVAPTTLPSPVNPALLHGGSVDLTVFTAKVNVELDKKLSAELLRSTKKEPPKQLTYSLIYTGKDEYDQSRADQNSQLGACESVFQGLRADLDGATHTRIFIGHATGQTTGIGGHMASYFIPTVERECIDLIDKSIALWNKELLYVGGFLSRAVYELELSKIQRSWEDGSNGTPESQPPAALQKSLHQRFLHILKFFTFHRSTPAEKVARLLQDAFYGCSTAPIRLLSSTGVRSAPEIKEFDLVLSQFLKHLPMLPQDVTKECPDTINALPSNQKMSSIKFSDVIDDLRKHPLTQDELVSCLRWRITRFKQDGSPRNTDQLLDAITIARTEIRPALQLSTVKYFISADDFEARIPSDGPLPTSLLPYDITQKFIPTDLASLGWKEFTVIDWLRYISQQEIMSADRDHDFTRSAEWAERILIVLSGVSPPGKLYRTAESIFKGKKCIPTTHGLCCPEDSFLPGTNLARFGDLDLPVVQLTAQSRTKGDIEGFLSSIGVRKDVPPILLLKRMMLAANWRISELINYIVQAQKPWNVDELSGLKTFKAFFQEGAQNTAGERSRHYASDLYPPLDTFRQLHLPVIDWGAKSKWRNDSDEAELLYRLGLCRYPPLDKIVELCTTPDTTIRETAFKYLCENLQSKYTDYNADKFRDIPFIPAENKDGPCLEKLGDVFLGTRWKALGFSIVQDCYWNAFVATLGVQQHPPAPRILERLKTEPPCDEDVARQWFESLLECIPDFSQQELSELSELPIVPTKFSGGWKNLPPTQCYLDEGTGTKDKFHGKLFVFVNFGNTANRFLKACGSKNEPSIKDIAETLVDNPERFYEIAGGHEGFLAELRDLASRSRRIPNVTMDKMMSEPVLLGTRRRCTTDGGGQEYEHSLRAARDIVIADDTNSLQLFEDVVFVAPQELEGFYASLGCRRLSNVVQEKYQVSKEIMDTETSAEVQSTILERLPLFLCEDTKLQIPPALAPNADNFSVRVCEKLVVSKTLAIGDVPTTREQDVWAATKCDEGGRIELWLSGSTKPDMYEIAASLCRLLFETTKVNDTLLLTTILSTPLDILKRRGYNVDSISKRHRHQQKNLQKEVNNNCFIPSEAPTISTMPTTTEPSTVVGSSESSTTHLVPGTSPGNTPPTTLLQKSVSRTSDNVRKPFRNIASRLVPHVRTSEKPPIARYPWTPRQVIPQNYIRAYVGKAIKACNREGASLLHHRNKVEEIRDFPSTGYCDLSIPDENVRRRGEIRNVKVFTPEDIPDPDNFMVGFHDTLSRFVDVLSPLSEVYDIPLNLFHVYYDPTGGPIAFNRKGRIFLNLRYFEAWHNEEVQNGRRQRAQVSWFLALAHELAHNLIKEHNSEHEFWFSAICETYISGLSQLLQPAPV